MNTIQMQSSKVFFIALAVILVLISITLSKSLASLHQDSLPLKQSTQRDASFINTLNKLNLNLNHELDASTQPQGQYKHKHNKLSNQTSPNLIQQQQHRHKRQWLSSTPISTHSNEQQINDEREGPLVVTSKGAVRGFSQVLGATGKRVDAFLGIPFAQPPLGRYRFKHPQPANEWQGELDARQYQRSCYQLNDTFFGPSFTGSVMWNPNTPLAEDCLYLNIWAPAQAVNDSSSMKHQQQQRSFLANKKRAVMVWIYGGGFVTGTASLPVYEGSTLATEEDVIVVSINYRLSSFGFLYLATPDAPGNAGLFDQLMALKWISDNIDQFGGDPNKVTLFGESAGAASVSFHLLSPLSRNLFHKAIMQSGAAMCPWALKQPNEMFARSIQLAASLRCPAALEALNMLATAHSLFLKTSLSSQPTIDISQIVECLLNADPILLTQDLPGSPFELPQNIYGQLSKDLQQQLTNLHVLDPEPKLVTSFTFVPVLDGSFFVESPAESLAKGNFQQANIMLGGNSDEANYFMAYYMPMYSHCPESAQGVTAPIATSSFIADKSSISNVKADDLVDNEHWSKSTPHYVTSSTKEEPLRGRYGRSVPLRPATLFKSPTNKHEADQLANPSHQTHKFISKRQATAPYCRISSQLPLMSRATFLKFIKEELNPYAISELARDAIAFEYTDWSAPNDSTTYPNALDKLVGDYQFTCPVNEFVDRYVTSSRTNNSVYMYRFAHRPSISWWPPWMGVLHADEIGFVFGEPLGRPDLKYKREEVDLSQRMMRFWANFAKFGDPTQNDEYHTVKPTVRWPSYNNHKEYLELATGLPRVGRAYRAKQCTFWAQYLPKLLDKLDKTECCDQQVKISKISRGCDKRRKFYPHELGTDGGLALPALGTAYGKFATQRASGVYSSATTWASIICISLVLFALLSSISIFVIRSVQPNFLSSINCNLLSENLSLRSWWPFRQCTKSNNETDENNNNNNSSADRRRRNQRAAKMAAAASNNSNNQQSTYEAPSASIAETHTAPTMQMKQPITNEQETNSKPAILGAGARKTFVAAANSVLKQQQQQQDNIMLSNLNKQQHGAKVSKVGVSFGVGGQLSPSTGSASFGPGIVSRNRVGGHSTSYGPGLSLGSSQTSTFDEQQAPGTAGGTLTAFDMAQKAAATVTNSAAAAIVVAKFKMFRSNTLAAAIGSHSSNGGEEQLEPRSSSQASNYTTNNQHPSFDMVSIRTNNDRVVNKLVTHNLHS